MQKTLGGEYKGSEREQFLKDNCDTMEEIGFMKRFTPEEITTKKDALAEISIGINDVETARKEAMADFKDQLKPMVEERATLLKDIKTKAEYKNELCFKFLDHVAGTVGYYTREGELAEERTMRPEEHQLTVKFLTGTNN